MRCGWPSSPGERQGYIREAATNYAPGTRIVDKPTTPRDLVGTRLEGELFLYVPPQTSPVPQAILDYAESQDVKIIDTLGRPYL